VVKGVETLIVCKIAGEGFSVLSSMSQFNQEALSHLGHHTLLANPILLLNAKDTNEDCLPINNSATNFSVGKVVADHNNRTTLMHDQPLLLKLSCVETGLVLKEIALEEQVANTCMETPATLVVILLAEVDASEETTAPFPIKFNPIRSPKFV